MTDLNKLGASVGMLLKEHRQTVAIAESSAGGLISASLVAVPGASAYFVGGGDHIHPCGPTGAAWSSRRCDGRHTTKYRAIRSVEGPHRPRIAGDNLGAE